MNRPPRSTVTGILNRKTALIIFVNGLLQSMLSLAIYLIARNTTVIISNIHEDKDLQLKAQRTLVFASLTTLQIVQSFLTKSVEESIFVTGISNNR